jgi:hypothetical protein
MRGRGNGDRESFETMAIHAQAAPRGGGQPGRAAPEPGARPGTGQGRPVTVRAVQPAGVLS